VYLDYYSAMLDDKQMFKQDLTRDGLHPNEAGYAVMAPLAEKAIAEALGRHAAHGQKLRGKSNPDERKDRKERGQ
jgi:hypothetical protein